MTGRLPNVTITPHGHLDADTAPMLANAAASLLAHPGHHLTLDLGAITFLNLAALSALVDIDQGARAAGCTVIVTNVPPHARHALSVAGLTHAE